jgi:Na+(H+)/acetate symporter ActP
MFSLDAWQIGEGKEGGLSNGLIAAVSVVAVLACGATAAGLIWWRRWSVSKDLRGRVHESSMVMSRLDAEPSQSLVPVPL